MKALIRILAAFALVYAMFAGLHTVGDLDVGWCLATGRWMVQHHRIPFTDVLSYTAHGQEWIYPLLSQLLLYLTVVLGGFSLLSWLGAAACTATVAIFLRRATAATALLALIAVPMVAARTEPRCEMFTEVLFAAFVSLLWFYHRSGRGPIWMLPVLMALWVNLHPGFIAGLGMCGAYVFLELGDMAFQKRRADAVARLRRAVPWLTMSVAATLVNPWGPRVYLGIFGQNDLNRIHLRFISEWMPVRLTPTALAAALQWRSPDGVVFWLLGAGLLAFVLALYLRRIGPAALLGASIYLFVHARRFEGLFASIVVIVGGTLIAEAFTEARPLRAIWQRVAPVATPLVLVAAAGFTAIRVSDLVTNRYYSDPPTSFGAGESALFPDEAAKFVLREHLSPNIFNDYDSGGFIAWALGPTYLDYIDGRAVPFGADLFMHSEKLLQSSLDSSLWQQEADQRKINTILVSLNHVSGRTALSNLATFCDSQLWRPVYLDGKAAVFVRVRPDTAELIKRLAVDCNTVRFDNPPNVPGVQGQAEKLEYYLDAASVLVVLDRSQDALEILERAERLFPDSPYLHYAKGVALQNTGNRDQAEHELRIAIDLGSEDALSALARYYESQGRYADEASILTRAAELADLSPDGYSLYIRLGYAQLALGAPERALISFDKADKVNPYIDEAAEAGAEFRERIAEGRAEARHQLLVHRPPNSPHAESEP